MKIYTLICFAAALGLSATGMAQPPSATGLKITQLSYGKNGTAIFTIPINSKPFLSQDPKHPIPASVAIADYNAKCQSAIKAARAYYSVPCKSFGDTSEQTNCDDQIPFKTASCSTPKVSNVDAFVQASGMLDITLGRATIPETADRRLYKISLPIHIQSTWGGASGFDRDIYKSTCERLKGEVRGSNSTLFVSCSEPVIKISCCENAEMTAEMDALVYAYADIKTKDVMVTGSSLDEMLAKSSDFLANETKSAGRLSVLDYCAPVNLSGAGYGGPAYSSECVSLTHSYKSLYKVNESCLLTEISPKNIKQSLTINDEDWGKLGHRMHIIRTSRGTETWRMDAKVTPSASGEVLVAKSGLTLTVQDGKGTLSHLDKFFKGVKPTDVMNGFTCTSSRR